MGCAGGIAITRADGKPFDGAEAARHGVPITGIGVSIDVSRVRKFDRRHRTVLAQVRDGVRTVLVKYVRHEEPLHYEDPVARAFMALAGVRAPEPPPVSALSPDVERRHGADIRNTRTALDALHDAHELAEDVDDEELGGILAGLSGIIIALESRLDELKSGQA